MLYAGRGGFGEGLVARMGRHDRGRDLWVGMCGLAMTSAQPLSFTVAFRRKMAELSQPERQEWLASLASRLRSSGGQGGVFLTQQLREVARGCRLPLVDTVSRQLGPFDPRHLAA